MKTSVMVVAGSVWVAGDQGWCQGARVGARGQGLVPRGKGWCQGTRVGARGRGRYQGVCCVPGGEGGCQGVMMGHGIRFGATK